MDKNKALVLFATIFFLNNASFAVENTKLTSRYPDYSYEFHGKDTCENFNRKIFIFNSRLNQHVIRPINIVWASVMPKYGMTRVQNFYTNLEFPVRLTSCLLQKDFKSSKTETVRFLTNTTLGIGGLYDPAKNKFKIEPRQEDMGQVLAHYNVKKGPYIVLPIIPSGSIRDIAGQVLDCPLNPSSYIVGPVVMMAKAVSLVNKTTNLQSIAKTINSTYADPYDIAKKLSGVEKYIKNSNLDRKEVLAQKTVSQNIIEIKNVDETHSSNVNLKADIKLNNYNPQNPLIDSMRTVMFEEQKIGDSKWSELSIWNKSFAKQIKTSSLNIEPKRQNYKYRYILQKNKTAPLAIIYPSIGEGITSHHSIVMAKIFYDEGYSVLIQGSPFQWEFVKSMPNDDKPGMPVSDAHYSRIVTSKIINKLEKEKTCKFERKILVGTSFGALITLFVAAKEEENNILGISNYISINPPIEILFALKQVDKYSQDWQNKSDDIKLKVAITAAKVLQVSQNLADNKSEFLPFSDDEAKLILGFVMKQKLSDLVFTIENSPKSKKSDIYKSINDMSFDDYAKKYLFVDQNKSFEQLNYETSLYSLANFLQKNEKYKIYHTLDDYYVNPEQLVWLKKQSDQKSVFFNNGSHLGFLYRKEFLDEFKKDIAFSKKSSNEIACTNKN